MTLVCEGEEVQVDLPLDQSSVKLPQELRDADRYSRALSSIPLGGDVPHDGTQKVGRRSSSARDATVQVPAEVAARPRDAIRVST